MICFQAITYWPWSTFLVNFLGPFIEVGECLVNGKFNTQFATVLMDFGLHFIARVIALQFCRSLEEIFLIPGLCEKIMGRFLVY